MAPPTQEEVLATLLGASGRLSARTASSAIPADQPVAWEPRGQAPARPVVAVLDSGIDSEEGVPRHPRLVDHVLVYDTGWCSPYDINDTDPPDADRDGILDSIAGHGTFIAGIVRRLAPDADIHVEGVLSSFGEGDDDDIAGGVRQMLDRVRPDIVNLSFSAFTDDDQPPPKMVEIIDDIVDSGAVVVASAGNDATHRPAWPAADPRVIAVAGLGSRGPARFTNRGSWVDACAPAVGVLSTFLEFDGPRDERSEMARLSEEVFGRDIDHFSGWAVWSGTSFAAPTVAAAIAAEMLRGGAESAEAADRVVGSGGLFRLPDLGTVVNGPRSRLPAD